MSDQNLNNDSSHTKAFVKSSEKYEDLNSSGITLVFTAILGYIFMILKTLFTLKEFPYFCFIL